MKMVTRRIPVKNLHYLPEGRSEVFNNWRRGSTVLCKIDVRWVQKNSAKYTRLLAE